MTQTDIQTWCPQYFAPLPKTKYLFKGPPLGDPGRHAETPDKKAAQMETAEHT